MVFKVHSFNTQKKFDLKFETISIKKRNVYDEGKLTIFKNRFLDSIRDIKHRKIKKQIKIYGCLRYKLSQTSGDINKNILKNKLTSGGICEALTLYWVKFHSNGDSLNLNLFNIKNKKLNKNLLNDIKKIQIEGILSVQNESSLNFLKKNNIDNINLLYEKTTYPILKTEITKDSKNIIMNQFKSIFDLKTGIYIKCDVVDNQLLGHTFAITKYQNKIIHFDSNIGESEFNSLDNFELWFKKRYWPYLTFPSKNYYSGSYNIYMLTKNK